MTLTYPRYNYPTIASRPENTTFNLRLEHPSYFFPATSTTHPHGPATTTPALTRESSADFWNQPSLPPFSQLLSVSGSTTAVSPFAQPQSSSLSAQKYRPQPANDSPLEKATEHFPVTSMGPQRLNKVRVFVPLPGVNHTKRPRRKYHEIERLYPCNYPGCLKSYGTLNHLNAHVAMQKHGPKRLPSEFKDLRRQRRLQKREQMVRQQHLQ